MLRNINKLKLRSQCQRNLILTLIMSICEGLEILVSGQKFWNRPFLGAGTIFLERGGCKWLDTGLIGFMSFPLPPCGVSSLIPVFLLPTVV